MAKLNIKFPKVEHSDPVVERVVRVAENVTARAQPVVTDVVPESSIVRTMPETPAAPRAVPMSASNPFSAGDAEPAPAVTASLAPRVEPDPVVERPLISAPMVFEAPKPADAQVLTELPKTEMVVVATAPIAPAVAETKPEPVAPKQAETQPEPLAVTPLPVPRPNLEANLAAEPDTAEYPKAVTIHLPLPKPPLSPAQRLELSGKDYDKAEKCLAQAIYFEARNESARGQQAVAQVVLNRVFSPHYPKDVCSVVYQNAHRHLSCQFTFACDGKPEAINDRGSWARANRIATQTLNAKVWLPEVNKATHYHAAYVRPNWIRDMKVMVRYGLHTFYRPRNWGDGSDEAHWGTVSNSVKPAANTGVKPLTPAQKRFAYRKT
jgi:hypothetical protein